MGCVPSGHADVVAASTNMDWSGPTKARSLASALAALDDAAGGCERRRPAARLAVVTAEIDSLQQEIKTFEEDITGTASTEAYAKNIHQVFVSLNLYRRPALATENEDFIANVNRKEMRRLELSWLHARGGELQRERRALHAQILRARALHARVQELLDSVWSAGARPGARAEHALARACALRDALAAVGARLRAAADYAQAAARKLDDALPRWKLVTAGKTGWERTAACAETCWLLVQARCLERGARRVLAAPAAPRASRALRLALDYAFTDALHDHKCDRATELFLQFKETVVQLISSINQLPGRLASAVKQKAAPPPPPPPPPPVKSPYLIDIVINGVPVKVPSHLTILQALRQERIACPNFCYHERLTVSGNCRMCLVHIEGMFKPQLACALHVAKNMKINTKSEVNRKAQEGVLEFLLINHPLDCPICDQGGECDLQDLSMRFGSDRSRFTDIHFQGKRAVENKELSPLIRAEMNRCIHCTRCIRFANQVSGVEILGTTGRGEDMLVGTYVDKMYLSEVSGNIVDLCPVGALTSIPYMFKARPWEVIRTNSIDVTDATGTNIQINSRFNRVLRVIPREHDEINQEWLSDKGRWAIDSLEMQRLVSPMARDMRECPLVAVDWAYAMTLASNMIIECDPYSLMVIAGPHCNVETLVAAKDFLNCLGSDHTYTERDFGYTTTMADIRAAYSLNLRMSDVAQADVIILIGTMPRFEAPILNIWIRQAYLTNECDIYYIGPTPAEFNYHVNVLGCDATDMAKVEALLKKAIKPLVFVGIDQLKGMTACDMMLALLKLTVPMSKPDWGVLNVIPCEASFAGAMEVGYRTNLNTYLKECCPKVIISLGADEFFTKQVPAECKVIFIGFQGDKGARSADLVLPGCAYTEAGGVFVNMEGRAQRALPAVSPPGKSRPDWKIVRALSEYCGAPLAYSDDVSLGCRMHEISPNLYLLGEYQPRMYQGLVQEMIPKAEGKPDLKVKVKQLHEYYCTDVFSTNSPTMLRTRKAAVEHLTTDYASV